MSAQGGHSEEVAITMVWPEGLADQASLVNMFAVANDLGQDLDGGVYLFLGHAGPPLWGSDEIVRDRVHQLEASLPVRPRGVYFMSKQRAEELWELLGEHLGRVENG